jgi:Protein of unknown function (DUF2637)
MRRASGAAVLLVAAIAATVSFLHIGRLAVQLGQPPLAAWLMPLSVDGTVCAASAALLWAARETVPAPVMARPMLALGVLATLGANADFGAAHGGAGIALSARPGIAFVGSAEVALGMVRRSTRAVTQADTEAVTVTATQADTEAVTVTATQADTEAVTVTATKRPPERSPRPVRPASRGGLRPRPAKRSFAGAAAIVRANPGISEAELGRKFGLSERQGRRLLVAATQAPRP